MLLNVRVHIVDNNPQGYEGKKTVYRNIRASGGATARSPHQPGVGVGLAVSPLVARVFIVVSAKLLISCKTMDVLLVPAAS